MTEQLSVPDATMAPVEPDVQQVTSSEAKLVRGGNPAAVALKFLGHVAAAVVADLILHPPGPPKPLTKLKDMDWKKIVNPA